MYLLLSQRKIMARLPRKISFYISQTYIFLNFAFQNPDRRHISNEETPPPTGIAFLKSSSCLNPEYANSKSTTRKRRWSLFRLILQIVRRHTSRPFAKLISLKNPSLITMTALMVNWCLLYFEYLWRKHERMSDIAFFGKESKILPCISDSTWHN